MGCLLLSQAMGAACGRMGVAQVLCIWMGVYMMDVCCRVLYVCHMCWHIWKCDVGDAV